MLKKKVFIVLALAVIVTLTGCSKFSRYGSDKNVLMQSVSGENTEGEEKKDASEDKSKDEKQENVNSQEQSEKNKDSSSEKTGVPQKYQKDEQFINSTTAYKNIDFKDSDMYAAAYIGYQDSSSIDYYKEKYLNSDNIETYNISGDEYYLVIPKSDDMKVQVYKMSIDNDKQELVQEFSKAVPFIVRCNVSDIFSDCKIVITTADGSKTVEFSPYISLKDGSFQVGENGIDITK